MRKLCPCGPCDPCGLKRWISLAVTGPGVPLSQKRRQGTNLVLREVYNSWDDPDAVAVPLAEWKEDDCKNFLIELRQLIARAQQRRKHVEFGASLRRFNKSCKSMLLELCS